MNILPSISIVTPVWNGLPYIKECIDSVLKQDFQNWELLVSDNGSSDGTIAYLDTLKDSRIQVFKQQKNLGILGNVNFLFSKASAPVTQILCADDYFIDVNSITEIMKYWSSASPEIGFVTFNHSWESKKMILNMDALVTPELISKGCADLWYFIFGNIPGNLSNVSIRTYLVSALGNFSENIPSAGDFEFWSRAARSVSMGVQKKNVTYVRRQDKVASNYLALKGEVYAEHILIYERLIQALTPFYDKEQLIDFFNYEICSFHFRNALKAAMNGHFSYLRQILKTRSEILWPKWQQLILCTSFALFNRKQQYTYQMAIKILKNQRHKERYQLHLEFNSANN
jgi:glycosyltransferase involved in cell wall biosynthesis